MLSKSSNSNLSSRDTEIFKFYGAINKLNFHAMFSLHKKQWNLSSLLILSGLKVPVLNVFAFSEHIVFGLLYLAISFFKPSINTCVVRSGTSSKQIIIDTLHENNSIQDFNFVLLLDL